MSKAFKCDSCLELFEGEPELTYDNYEICDRCVRIAKLFNKVDPFETVSTGNKKSNEDEPKYGNAFTMLYNLEGR